MTENRERLQHIDFDEVRVFLGQVNLIQTGLTITGPDVKYEGLAKRLLEKGYVERKEYPNQTYGLQYALTVKGEEALAIMCELEEIICPFPYRLAVSSGV